MPDAKAFGQTFKSPNLSAMTRWKISAEPTTQSDLPIRQGDEGGIYALLNKWIGLIDVVGTVEIFHRSQGKQEHPSHCWIVISYHSFYQGVVCRGGEALLVHVTHRQVLPGQAEMVTRHEP